MVAGVYYASIYSKTLTSEWDSIDNGNFQNKEQFRIGIVDDCVDKIVYSCDFESELLNWTFAQADGINTGFVVDTAMKYQGKKSLYISPDGGKSTGYTQDGDSGYVSVAYKKIYLESGSYYLYHYIYRQLSFSYLDIFSDNDYYNISIIPAENKIEPLSHYKYSPSFFNNSRESQYYSSNYSYWNNYSYDFSINKSGYYYLVHTFLATDTITNNVGVAIDNIRIEKRKRSSSSISISKTETKEGVVFNINGNYPEYRVYWYTDCDRTTKRDTITNNTYTIPFSKLRDIRYGGGDLYFYVCATDECGNSNCSNYYNSYSVYTSEFPTDTCPAVPKNLKVTITDSTAIFTWQGNSSIYDIKYGKESDGCTFIDFGYHLSNSENELVRCITAQGNSSNIKINSNTLDLHVKLKQ